MVIFNLRYMKISQLYIIILIAIIPWITGCDRDAVDNVDFSVKVMDNAHEFRVGEEVTFMFEGNVDYLSFFSGENGNNYANINRGSVDLTALQLGCTIKQQYTDTEYRGKEILHVYLSDDFNGMYTLEGIQKANWKKISGRESNQLAVPMTQQSSTDEVASSINLMDYKDRPFYIAFQYNAPKRLKGTDKYDVAPRIDVNPMTLSKTTVTNETVVWNNPSTDFGFQVVYENSMQQSNYQVQSGQLLFQPVTKKEYTDEDVIVWMVSTLIQPQKVEPDRGVAIKSTTAHLYSYTHVYSQPGTYEVVFVATNANMWNANQIIKKLTLTIKE